MLLFYNYDVWIYSFWKEFAAKPKPYAGTLFVEHCLSLHIHYIHSGQETSFHIPTMQE